MKKYLTFGVGLLAAVFLSEQAVKNTVANKPTPKVKYFFITFSFY